MKNKIDLTSLKMVALVAMVNALGGTATMKTFSQRSKAVERLEKLATEKGIKLEDKFDLEGNELPPPPSPEAKKAEAVVAEAKAKAKDKPAKKEKGPSIRSFAEALLMEVVSLDEDRRKVGHPYEVILEKIRERYEGAKTSVACLRWYAVHMRERGEMPPSRPRAVPVKASTPVSEEPSEA